MRVVALLLAGLALGAAAPLPLLLDGHNLDPALLLPPPPDGASARAELAELHRIDGARTPDEIAHAKADDAAKSVAIFAAAIGPSFDLEKLPATEALFAIVRAEEKAAADRAKALFRRSRPWIVDAGLHSCSTDDEAWSSYPSGHTTMGYAMGAILARLVPARAPQILARAAEYGHSRLVCEMHFPSDITAGQAYGMMVAERLMEAPAFRARFDAAAQELKAAGIAR